MTISVEQQIQNLIGTYKEEENELLSATKRLKEIEDEYGVITEPEKRYDLSKIEAVKDIGFMSYIAVIIFAITFLINTTFNPILLFVVAIISCISMAYTINTVFFVDKKFRHLTLTFSFLGYIPFFSLGASETYFYFAAAVIWVLQKFLGSFAYEYAMKKIKTGETLPNWLGIDITDDSLEKSDIKYDVQSLLEKKYIASQRCKELDGVAKKFKEFFPYIKENKEKYPFIYNRLKK